MILPVAVAALDSVTVVSRAEPGWLWGLEGFIAVVVAVLLIALLTSYLVIAVMLKRAFDRLSAAVERFRGDIYPVTQRAAEIAEHLEEAASNVNDAVGDVADTLRAANDTMRDVVETAEERFRELDAIVQVARDEAEDLVTGAASTVRGVRGGIRAFRDQRRSAPAFAREAQDDPEAAPPPPARRRRGGPRIRRAAPPDDE
jgi:hypothetical protein